jgi:hypothetical protein
MEHLAGVRLAPHRHSLVRTEARRRLHDDAGDTPIHEIERAEVQVQVVVEGQSLGQSERETRMPGG